jgi:hypothetical protein
VDVADGDFNTYGGRSVELDPEDAGSFDDPYGGMHGNGHAHAARGRHGGMGPSGGYGEAYDSMGRDGFGAYGGGGTYGMDGRGMGGYEMDPRSQGTYAKAPTGVQEGWGSGSGMEGGASGNGRAGTSHRARGARVQQAFSDDDDI